MNMKQRVSGLISFQRAPQHGTGVRYLKPAWRLLYTLIVLFLSWTAPCSASAAEGRGYLDMNGGYKTGDFGTPVKSDLWYFSPALGRVTTQHDVSVTIPYLFLTNKVAGQSFSENGIGDIILRGGLVLIPEAENGFSLAGSLSVKIPTADENKGLGTGKADYGGFFGVRKSIGQNRFMLSAGYIKAGDPSGVDLNDVYVYDIGYSKVFYRTEVSGWYEGRRATIPGARNPQEINIGFFHILNNDYSVKGSAFSSLNDGGPDFGLNSGIVRWF